MKVEWRRSGWIWCMRAICACLATLLLGCATHGTEGCEAYVAIPAIERVRLGPPLEGPSDADAGVVAHFERFEIAADLVTTAEFVAFLNSEFGRTLASGQLIVEAKWPQYDYPVVFLDKVRWCVRAGSDVCPVTQATWYGAMMYAAWKSYSDPAFVYSLPTEWEWEYAARGAEGRRWPWGDSEPTREHGMRWHGFSRREQALRSVSPSRSFPRGDTPLGVHDMMSYGMAEWCANVFTPDARFQPASGRAADASLALPRAVPGFRDVPKKDIGLLDAFLSAIWDEAMVWDREGEDPVRGPLGQAVMFRLVRRPSCSR
jgi:hypothetical protein